MKDQQQELEGREEGDQSSDNQEPWHKGTGEAISVRLYLEF